MALTAGKGGNNKRGILLCYTSSGKKYAVASETSEKKTHRSSQLRFLKSLDGGNSLGRA